MKPITLGRYKITHCTSTLTKKIFYRVYIDNYFDPISQHDTIEAAQSAVNRYIKGDKRHAKENDK